MAASPDRTRVPSVFEARPSGQSPVSPADEPVRGPTDDREHRLVSMLEDMLAARIASQRLFNLQRQGRIGTFAPIDGQEAVVVGAAHALNPATDWIVPQYREMVALRRYGHEVLDRAILQYRGHPEGGYFPPGIRVFPVQISLAAQIPHAVGLAWGLQLRGEPGVVLAFFGDGASSEGDFYEAANFAGVLRAPVVLLCVNNGWAISTPTRVQTSARTFAAKAEAVGFDGVRVDGNDVLAVHEVVKEAVDRARTGTGPTLVEAVTYRLGAHTTSDDPARYVPAEDLEEWRRRDPISRLAAHLSELGLWDSRREESFSQACTAELEEAIARAEAAQPAPDAFFDHLYARPTVRMERQRSELLDRVAPRSL